MTVLSRLRALAASLVIAAGFCVSVSGFAQTSLQNPVHSGQASAPVGAAGWINRLRRAAEQQSYTGTLVVLTDAGQVAGSRVTHACQQGRQIERVDVLDGPARTVFRRDGEMRTFFHATRTFVDGATTASTFFPSLQSPQADQLDALYRAVSKGVERVADHDADVVWLVPRDALRFGYRIWSEQGSGLVLRVQTVQEDGRVLEQASFLQIELTSPSTFDRLSKAMDDVLGYALVTAPRVQREAASGGLRLRSPVPGFALQGCRVAAARANTTQCTYADGLASVSIFVESLVSADAPQATANWSAGATRAIATPLDANTRLTVIGEVPAATLLMFAQLLER